MRRGLDDLRGSGKEMGGTLGSDSPPMRYFHTSVSHWLDFGIQICVSDLRATLMLCTRLQKQLIVRHSE